jgi:UMF1 family MFS transporter
MKKNLGKSAYSWILYDWANSAFATTVMAGFFPIFFKQFYSSGTDVTLSTAKLGISSSLATLLIALTSPLLGALADKKSKKKFFLVLFCWLGAMSSGLLYFVGQGQWEWAVFLFILASYGFAASNGLYDSLLPDVTHRENYDKVSGLGYAFGYLGGGLLFLLNVIMFQKPELFGFESGADAVRFSFFTVAVWWILFSIPLMIWVQEKKKSNSDSSSLKNSWRDLLLTVKSIARNKNVSLFLIAFLIYNDGVGTTIRMAVDYGMSIGLESSDLIKALLLVQFIGFPAAVFFGRITALVKPKWAITFCLGVYLFVVLFAYKMNSATEFYVLAAAIGLVQGGVQALSRSFFARMIPTEKSGEYFGFYNLLGKFAGLIGPTLMALTGFLFSDSRIGILSLSILFIAGAILLFRVEDQQSQAVRP